MGAIEAGHQPHARVFERGRHRSQIARLDANVAVVHQQQFVPGAPSQFGQHPGLGIRRCSGDHVDRDGHPGEVALQAADVLDRAIPGIAHAEQNLEFRMVLPRVGRDGLVESRVAAMHGLQNGDAARRAGCRPRSLPSPADSRPQRQQPVRRGRPGGQRPRNHRATRATPHTTSEAPAQRIPLTRSFRTYLASTVSSTQVTAVAGTAKLKSEIVSRPS